MPRIIKYKGAHPCRWCGKIIYTSRGYCNDDCMKARHNNLRGDRAKEQRQGGKPYWADSACTSCKHLEMCRTTVKAGAILPCQPAEAAPIPVVGWDVTSEFDGISITESVWREQR